MKVVRVRHIKDTLAKEYLFETKRNLNKGDIVLVSVKTDKENVAVCTSGSIEISVIDAERSE